MFVLCHFLTQGDAFHADGAETFRCGRRFYLALIAIANYRHTRQRKDKIEAEKHIKFFKGAVKKGSINLVHKLQLLHQADMMTTERNSKKNADAIFAKYEDAIAFASRTGFLQVAALANYLCYQFCREKDVRILLAEMYLKWPVEQWSSWQAFAVAESPSPVPCP